MNHKANILATIVLLLAADATFASQQEQEKADSIVRKYEAKQPLWCARFSPSGDKVAAGGEGELVFLWDATTGELLKSLEGHTSIVTGVAFSPDGSQLLTGSFDGSVILWDCKSGDLVRIFRSKASWIGGVAFSPDGKQVLAASDIGGVLWQLSGELPDI